MRITAGLEIHSDQFLLAEGVTKMEVPLWCDVSSADETARRGSGNFFATARKLSVTETGTSLGVSMIGARKT